jgi:phasin
MTEATTAANKAKMTKPAASSFDMPDYGTPKSATPKFEMPKFDLPNMEMPQALREMAEKGVEQTRDAYAKAKVASDGAAEMLENTYEAAASRVTNYNRKLFEIVRLNTSAAFDYAHELLGAKSPSELIALSTAQMHKQFAILSAQNRQLCALAQEAATEVAEPIKTGVAKALDKAT